MSGNVIYLNNYTSKQQLEALLEEVQVLRTNPEDEYEIAALLESIGWNDEKASKSFGVSDVFELAEVLLEMTNDTVHYMPVAEEKKEGMLKQTKKILKSFLRGIIFALPMAISVFAMLTLRLSLWSYEKLSVEIATSIAVGTILSFMTVGGFTQIIARRGFSYIEQGFYSIAKKVTYFFVILGFLTCFLVCVLYAGINTYFNNFPYIMFIISILYYFFLCLIWLSVTVMYLLRKEFTFTGVITIGILLVYVLFQILKLNIILSQVIALLVVSIIAWIIVIQHFNSAEKKMEKGLGISLPRKSILLYTLRPYFIYGFLYFTFIYMDRIMSWSSNSFYMPYVFWFRGQYELGLDFAILILIIPMGVCEVLVTNIMVKIDAMQKNSWHNEIQLASGTYINYYLKCLFTILITSIISTMIITLLIYLIYLYGQQTFHIGLFFNPTSIFVYTVGVISYCLLSVALTNAVTLFSLSQPNMVIKSLSISLFVNFIVGFLLSRWVDYSWGVMGLLAGTILFAILSTKSMFKVMNHIDYYIYAAV